MRSLDIILCSGNGKMSRAIKVVNRIAGYSGPAAEITHVALVYKEHLKRPHVFESTAIGMYGQKGVQNNNYPDWLQSYNGLVYRRELICPDELYIPATLLYPKFISDNIGKPYESGIPGLIELTLCGLPFLRKIWRTPELHCSELDVLCYQNGGLSRVLPANMFPPASFWQGEIFERTLTGGVSLGDPERLK